jgi:Putative transposase/Transposase zinc-binding domain
MDGAIPLSAEIAREFPPEYPEPRYEVADIFREYGPDYRATHTLSPLQHKAMTALERCRSSALGAHIDVCDQCGHTEISYNSCRNRNCPKCRGSQRRAWVEARELELLPIQYFHLVFTLPEALLGLARFNPAILYDLLFRIAAETLQTFAHNRWDAKLGIIMVLHTWGQTLNEHPHVHCIVTGGALAHDGSRFIRAPKNFLFPVTALSRVFRAKFLAALERARSAGKLDLTGLPALSTPGGWNRLRATLLGQDWVVYANPPFAEPQHLIRYLGRYVNRIAIANHRILSIDGGHIRFRYTDYRDGQEKIMDLTAEEFIRRFLTHVLPRGFRRIRYYGFLVNSQRKAKLTRCRALLGLPNPDQPYIADLDAYLTQLSMDPRLCPRCGQGTMKAVEPLPSFHDPPAWALEAA